MAGPAPRTLFHCRSADRDPESLLDPDEQVTEPWGGPEHGPCDKCGGERTVAYECLSCSERGADPDCPACEGRVTRRDLCPACLGTGEITHTRRRGIAVFPTREGLYRYLARTDANVEGKVIVEVVGRIGEEPDLDADAGALLAHPERIVAVEPLDPDVVLELREPEVQ